MKPGITHLCCVILMITLAVSGCTSPALKKDLNSSANNTPTPGIPLGRGQFVFNDSLGNADRPITVYSYRPVSWNTSGPILIVMPGAGRDGQSPRETWIPYAEQYSSLVIVPEFSLANYPGDLWYNRTYAHPFEKKLERIFRICKICCNSSLFDSPFSIVECNIVHLISRF